MWLTPNVGYSPAPVLQKQDCDIDPGVFTQGIAANVMELGFEGMTRIAAKRR